MRDSLQCVDVRDSEEEMTQFPTIMDVFAVSPSSNSIKLHATARGNFSKPAICNTMRSG